MNRHFEVRGSQAIMEIGARIGAFAVREGRTRCRWKVLWMLGLSLALAPNARAGFIGYYSPGNWTLTNTDTDGTYVASPDGLSVVLTGGNHGSALGGTTDFIIQSIGTGKVEFQYSYFSLDVPPPGCGPGASGPCDLGLVLLNGSVLKQLADDVNQGTGTFAFNLNVGDTFGFRVQTLDNTGEPGILTISEFSAPVPEPGTTPLICLAIAAMIAARVRARRPRTANSHR